jgi:hypothetical protein
LLQISVERQQPTRFAFIAETERAHSFQVLQHRLAKMASKARQRAQRFQSL